jgi:transcriptional regulator GlxA family with amidase domain
MLVKDSTNIPQRTAILLLPKFSSLTLASLVEPMRIANYSDGRQLYRWEYISADGADVPGCSGYSVPSKLFRDIDDVDSIIVCGGWNAERFKDASLLSWLRTQARKGVTMGAVEMGSYLLAEAGLLKDCKATIHWHCHNAFAERYPEIDLQQQLYIVDKNRVTCAGGNACVDMILHDIEQRYGSALSTEVADQMIHASARQGEQPQRPAQSADEAAVPPVLVRAVSHMETNIENATRIPELADALGLSQRKLERLFNKHFGCPAVAYYRKVRLQHARVLLTQTDMSVLDICIACGFASSSYFSKSYAEQFGLRPRDHRLAWPDSESHAHWPALTRTTASQSRN